MEVKDRTNVLWLVDKVVQEVEGVMKDQQHQLDKELNLLNQVNLVLMDLVIQEELCHLTLLIVQVEVEVVLELLEVV
jgi:hypothetical protein